MAYNTIPFSSLGGGINLRDAPDVVSEAQAIDLLNVEFNERGSMRQRSGYAQFTSPELTNQPDSMHAHYESDGTKHLIVGNGNRLDAVNTSGASVANASPTASPHFFVRFGSPTSESTYIANGTDTIRKYDGSSFTSPAGFTDTSGTPGSVNISGKFVAIAPQSNRLMVARESGTASFDNPSTVKFSVAGDPEDWDTADGAGAEELDPGDGEPIMGMIAFRDMVFIFKQTKFWVYYGESTTQAGAADFLFRKVNVGIGLEASQALCVGRDGVYFLGKNGVYKTTGGDPELISDPISPFFEGTTSFYYKSDTLNDTHISKAAMHWRNDRLYLAIAGGSSTVNSLMWVHDTEHEWWSLWDIPAAAITSFKIGDPSEVVFAAPAGDNHVYRHSDSYTADGMSTTGTGGTAITARWRSGWFDLNDRNVKRIRQTKIWGYGSFTFSISKDFEDVGSNPVAVSISGAADTWGDGTGTDLWGDGSSSSDLWGPTTAIDPWLVRESIRGTTFSILVTNTTINTPMGIYRLDNHVTSPRIPSTVSTDE